MLAPAQVDYFPVSGDRPSVRDAKGSSMVRAFGLLLLLLGISMVMLGRARDGENHRPFLRGGLMGEMYAVICLGFIVAGAGMLVHF